MRYIIVDTFLGANHFNKNHDGAIWSSADGSRPGAGLEMAMGTRYPKPGGFLLY
jgi:hypothetical protein